MLLPGVGVPELPAQKDLNCSVLSFLIQPQTEFPILKIPAQMIKL